MWVGIRIGVDRSGSEWSGSEYGSRRERIGASLVIGAGFNWIGAGFEWIGAGFDWIGAGFGWIGAGFELFCFRCGVERSFTRERIGAGFEWLRRGVSGSELQRSWLCGGVSGSELW